MKQRLGHFAAGLALFAASEAQAAKMSCLSADEMRGVVTWVMPSVLGDLRATCSSHLPADAYLNTGMVDLAERFGELKALSWPMTRQALIKIAAGKSGKSDDLLNDMTDETMRALVDEVFAKEFTLDLKPRDCPDVNDVTEALAPLTPEQSITLWTVVFNAVMRQDRTMKSCPRTS